MRPKTSFSTLACPAWTVDQILAAAAQWSYNGIEFRVVQGELDLWKLPEFHGAGIGETRRRLADHELTLPCIQSSARFDSPDPTVRKSNFENAEHTAELAHALEAPAIRVFGDRMQPGCSQDETAGWVAESLLRLAAKLEPAGVAVWLETHGNFSTSQPVVDLLKRTGRRVPLIWDPANALEEFGEAPEAAASAYGSSIAHVHLKDFRRKQEGGYEYTLIGEGEMPLDEIRRVLDVLEYQGFISFEWEKQWHPELAGPEVALPHFAAWFREHWLD